MTLLIPIFLLFAHLLASFLWFYYNPFRVTCQPFYNIFFIIFISFHLTNNKNNIIIVYKGGLANGNHLRKHRTNYP